MKPRILVVDDEAAIRDSLRMILEYEDYQFVGAASGQEAVAIVQRDRPDLVMLDIKMPGMDGLTLLERVKEHDPAILVLMMTGHASIETAVDAIRKGAQEYIPKQFTPPQIRFLVGRAF